MVTGGKGRVACGGMIFERGHGFSRAAWAEKKGIGLKPSKVMGVAVARLKPCPDTKHRDPRSEDKNSSAFLTAPKKLRSPDAMASESPPG